MNTTILIPRRKHATRTPITRRIVRKMIETRKQLADFIHYLKRGHSPRTAWRMAQNVL